MAITIQTIRIPPSLWTLAFVYQPPTDTPPDDPVDGDELFENENDETPEPEDPAEQITIQIPRLIYANRNPRTPCPVCQPLVGTVWQPGCQPRLPRHDHCMCFYQEAYLTETKNRNRFRHKPQNQAAPEDKLI